MASPSKKTAKSITAEASVKTAKSTAAEVSVKPRLKERYQKEIIPLLMKEFSYKNPMQVPRLSKIVLNVEGESQRNQAIQSTDFGSFYDRISIANNSLSHVSGGNWIAITANILIILMLGGAAYFVFKPKA